MIRQARKHGIGPGAGQGIVTSRRRELLILCARIGFNP